MTTAATILNRASRQLLSGTVEERNKLASTINDSSTSVVLSYDLGGFRAGSVFELESELIYIWEANTATKTLTVERGFAAAVLCSMEIVGERPSIYSTEGFCICSKN